MAVHKGGIDMDQWESFRKAQAELQKASNDPSETQRSQFLQTVANATKNTSPAALEETAKVQSQQTLPWLAKSLRSGNEEKLIQRAKAQELPASVIESDVEVWALRKKEPGFDKLWMTKWIPKIKQFFLAFPELYKVAKDAIEMRSSSVLVYPLSDLKYHANCAPPTIPHWRAELSRFTEILRKLKNTVKRSPSSLDNAYVMAVFNPSNRMCYTVIAIRDLADAKVICSNLIHSLSDQVVYIPGCDGRVSSIYRLLTAFFSPEINGAWPILQHAETKLTEENGVGQLFVELPYCVNNPRISELIDGIISKMLEKGVYLNITFASDIILNSAEAVQHLPKSKKILEEAKRLFGSNVKVVIDLDDESLTFVLQIQAKKEAVELEATALFTAFPDSVIQLTMREQDGELFTTIARPDRVVRRRMLF